MPRLIFVLFFVFFSQVQAATFPVQLGDETVKIEIYRNGPGKTFVHLHQNETTALRAAKAVIKKDGGTVLTLKHNGARNIIFHLHKKRYELDPNRIYTDIGIKKTLTQFGPYSKDAHQEVKKLADKIKTLIPAGKIIAVHNNRSYSLKDYLPGHRYERDASTFYFEDKKHFRNFYLVTKKKDYNRLKALDFNSVLQSSEALDDGSLSIFLAESDYINVEAGYGELLAQINMLRHA